MERLHIDLETYCDLPIGGPNGVGAFRYVDDPSFEILLFGYKVDDAPTVCIDLTAGEILPAEIRNALLDPAVVKTAWNAAFERYCLFRHFARLHRPPEAFWYMPPEQWEDTMILAANCGLPLKLEMCCEALHMSEDKAKLRIGTALIREFCGPVRPKKKWNMATRVTPDMDPENWALFKAYNIRDVDTEADIDQRLRKWRPGEIEHRFWCLDARINEKGFLVDRKMVRNAMEMDAKYKAELAEKAVAVSGIENPNSTSQIKDWLLEQEGLEVPSLNKKVAADVVAALKTDRAKEFMAIRRELAKASTKKYAAYLRCTSDEKPYARGCFQFFGGHTGRFAGRLIQLQNLPGNSMPDLDDARNLVLDDDYAGLKLLYPSVTQTLSELLRTPLIAEPGHQLIVCDFSAIEARVSAWFAGEEAVLEEFRGEGLIYEATASLMFHVPKQDIRKGGPREDLRKKGKIATLACGYGGGVNSLLAFGADRMGMTNEEMVNTVDLWRAANPRIVRIWSTLDRAMARCIVSHGTAYDALAKIRFRWDSGIVWMRLPSGREMAYFEPKYEPSKRKGGKMTISYMGQDQKTKKWQRIETWGGRIFENLVQATARDCLRDTMLRLDDRGWDIRGHVHDEVICQERIDGRTVADMRAVFSEPIDWAPGLPLSGAGYATPYYIKD